MTEIDYVLKLIDRQQEQLWKLSDAVFRLSVNKPSPEMQDDRVNIAWNQGIAKGKAEEREAIVAWLREDDTASYWQALQIERGEHLRSDDE